MATVLPDGGRPYVSKVFNDHWMREHGYLPDEGTPTVGDVLASKGEVSLLTVGSHDVVQRALELMREHGVSQVPVVSGEDERAVVGTVSERSLLLRLGGASGDPGRAGHRGPRRRRCPSWPRATRLRMRSTCSATRASR